MKVTTIFNGFFRRKLRNIIIKRDNGKGLTTTTKFNKINPNLTVRLMRHLNLNMMKFGITVLRTPF